MLAAFDIEAVYGIGVLVVIVWGFLAFAAMPKKFSIKPRDPESLDNLQLMMAEDLDNWAQQYDTDFLGYYDVKYGMSTAFFIVWKFIDAPRYFCCYVISQENKTITSYDIVTEFENDITLTSNNMKMSIMLPKPTGKYFQVMKCRDLDELFGFHFQAEQYLTENAARYAKEIGTFEEQFTKYMKAEKAYNNSHFLRYLLVPYYYFIRKHLVFNKTIQQQHLSGKIKMPNELATQLDENWK